jgi:hypothetical protein
MRSAAFQNDSRDDISIVASGVKPAARAEPAVQEQQRLIRKLADIDWRTPSKRMRWRDHGQGVSRVQQAADEQLITGAGKYYLHVALSEPVADTCPAILDEMYVDWSSMHWTNQAH